MAGAWLALTVLAATPALAGERLRLGVAPFANKTGDARFDAVSKGLADMLTTDLAHAKDLQLVERERISAVIAELKLGRSRWVDKKSAQRAGKLLGADLVLVGAVTAWQPTLRLDARMISVETGEVMVTASAQGPQREFFKVEAALAGKLLKGFGVAVSPLMRMKLSRAPTRSWAALRAYSKGLDAHDMGDKASAERAYRAALSADPSFERAKAQLEKLGKRVAALEKRTAAVERAGGLILKPTTAVEHWSNHKVFRARGNKAQALASAQAALALQPGAVDALWWLCEVAPEGQAPALGGAKVPSERAALVCAIARKQGVAAARLGAPLVPAHKPAAAAQLAALQPAAVVTAWLRLRALRPPASPTVGAALRAESVAVALLLGAALRHDKGRRALDGAFLDADGRSRARAFVATTLAAFGKRVAPGNQRRGALYAQALTVRLSEHVGRLSEPPLLLQVRFAEPSVADVTVQWQDKPWQLVPRALPRGADVAVWQVALRDPAPSGATRLTIRWTDGHGARQVDQRTWDLRVTTNGRWRQRGTGLGARVSGRFPLLSTPFAPRDTKDRGGRLLIDPVVGLWSAPLPTSLDRIEIQPLLAGRPSVWANGDLLDFARPAAGLKRIGLVRPLIYARRDGAVRVLGAGRYYRQTRGDKVTYVSETGTLRAEQELQVRPIFTAPSVHTLGLATTRPAAALRAWRDAMESQPAPAALWELSTESGLYAALWTACPLAPSRSAAVVRLRRWVRLGGDMRAARLQRQTWAARLLALCGDRGRFDALWAQAKQADANASDQHHRWRYRAEVATALVLAHGWPKDRSTRVLAALRGAPGHSLEASLLTAAAVSARRDRSPAAEVTVGGRRVWLGRDEVSVAAYRSCVQAGACRELTDVTCAVGRGRDKRPLSAKESGLSSDFGGDQLTHCLPLERGVLPQNGVQWADAARYCAWRGGQLPAAQELRAAAQGVAGQGGAAKRPWVGADDNLLDRVTCAWTSFRRKPPEGCGPGAPGTRLPWDRYAWIAPVGAHPGGEGVSGVAHLVGNLREWVRDKPGQVLGCSFRSAPEDPASCLATPTALGTPAADDVGFRCAYDRAPKPPPRAKRRRSRKPKFVRWAKVPAGSVQLGLDPKAPLQPAVSLGAGAAPSSSKLRRLSDAVPEAKASTVHGFVRTLRGLGVEGEVSARLLEELVARARWRGLTPAQAFDAVVVALRDLNSKPFKAAFETSLYVPSARRRAKGDAAKTRALLWQDLSRRLLREARFPKPRGAPRWRKRESFDCGDQPTGQCRDHTGTSGHRPHSSVRPRPKQVVRVAGFRMMTHEVTQADFAAVLGRRPSFFDCPRCAVERVSFADAAAFCARVGGRLPTEAEWVRAAAGRLGRDAPLRSVKLDRVARYAGNTSGTPPKVGTRQANAFGLYDLLGGVWEWTADRWSDPWRLRTLTTRLKVQPRSRLRRAPTDRGEFCIRANHQLRFAEQRLNALPWVQHERDWYACFATQRAGEQAVEQALTKAPLGPDAREDKRAVRALHTLRGGAWATDSRLVSRVARAPMGARLRSPFVGFRCVR